MVLLTMTRINFELHLFVIINVIDFDVEYLIYQICFSLFFPDILSFGNINLKHILLRNYFIDPGQV